MNNTPDYNYFEVETYDYDREETSPDSILPARGESGLEVGGGYGTISSFEDIVPF